VCVSLSAFSIDVVFSSQSLSAGRDPRAVAANDPRLRSTKLNDQPPAETSLSPPASPPPQPDPAAVPDDLEVNGLSREVLYILRRITVTTGRPPTIPAHVSAEELKQRNDPRLLHYRSTIHSGMLKPAPSAATADPPPIPRKPQTSPPPPFTLPDIVLPPIGTPLPPAAKPASSPGAGLEPKQPSMFSPERTAPNAAVKMPEALQEKATTRTVDISARRPSGGFETASSSSDKKVIDYRNDPRYKKKKTRSVSKDDDGFLSPKSGVDSSPTVPYAQEDFDVQFTRSAGSRVDLPSPSAGFSDRVGKSRVSELGAVQQSSSGRSSDSEGQVSPPAMYGAAASQELPSFLLPSSELGEDSPHEEVSLKDMFKTIDPTTSPFC